MAVFGAGFAVLLGLGMAAVYQTFVWENSVTQVARAYESLNKLPMARSLLEGRGKASALRFVSNGTDKEGCHLECRRCDLADKDALFADLDSTASSGSNAAFRCASQSSVGRSQRTGHGPGHEP